MDFRQYLNAGTNLPSDNGMINQDHRNASYIKTTSFNTAANVKLMLHCLTIDLMLII